MKPMTIALTGAAGRIGYALAPLFARGDLFPQRPIRLVLIDIPEKQAMVRGVAAELCDCAFPMLQSVEVALSFEEGIAEADCIVLIGAAPRQKGETRSDLLQRNSAIFYEQGKAIGAAALKGAKVLVVGNPCNTNAWIVRHASGRSTVYALSKLDQLRLHGQLAQYVGCLPSAVEGGIIWGNHSATMVVDTSLTTINGQPCSQVIQESVWLTQTLPTSVQNRGSEILALRGASSVFSAAHAIACCVQSMFVPTPAGESIALATCLPRNPWNIDPTLIFAAPCRTEEDGTIVPNYTIMPQKRLHQALQLTEGELQKEQGCVAQYLGLA